MGLLFGLAGVAIALAFAGALSAAQMLPAIETAPLTNRGEGVPFDVAAETSYPPLEFLEFLFPGFLGDSTTRPPTYWGRWGVERIVTDYMGLLPVVLFFYALVAARDRNRWFWLAVVVAAGVMAAGRFTPVYGWAHRWFPGIDRFRSPATAMVFMTWSAAIVAGLGLDRFLRNIADAARRRQYPWILIPTAIACFAVAVLLTALETGAPFLDALGLSFPRKPASKLSTLYDALQRSAVAASLACVLLAILVVTATRVFRGNRLARGLALCGLFALAFLDPRLHEARYIKSADARPFHLYLFHHWSDSITRKLPPPVRGIEADNERSNRMMTRGLATLHGYHPVHLQAYLDLLDLYAQNHTQLGRLVFEQFVLTPEKRSPGPEYEAVAARDGKVLWLRRPPPPYAYFPATVEMAADRQALLLAMAQEDFDPYRRSYTLDPWIAYGGDADSTATVRLVAHAPNRIELAVSTPRERPLVVAELAAPGWECITDTGLDLPIAQANYAFRAFRVPAGESRVSLVYRPYSFRLGLYLTLLSLFLLMVFAATTCVFPLSK